MLRPKRVQDSRTEQIQILMPEHINGAGRLFGGKLVEWIDVVAGVVARRHSGRNVITLSLIHISSGIVRFMGRDLTMNCLTEDSAVVTGFILSVEFLS